MSLRFGVSVNPDNGSLKADKMLRKYFREFEHLKYAPIKMLELGVFNGGSLNLWDEYFPNGSVFGIDQQMAPGLCGEEEVRCYVGQQQDTAFLDQVAAEAAPEGFDIIIDDCSHIGELTKISFWHLFENHLKPGGIYAIEDWLTGYFRKWEDGRPLPYDPKDRPPENGRFHGHPYGMSGFVKELVDEFGRGTFFTPAPDRNRTSRFAEIKFLDNLVFVYKRAEYPSQRDC